MNVLPPVRNRVYTVDSVEMTPPHGPESSLPKLDSGLALKGGLTAKLEPGGSGMSVQAICWVLDNSKAKLASRLVLLAVANHADPRGVSSWPSVALIASEALVTERQVQRSLATLESIGELTIHRGIAPGGRHVFVLAKMARPRCWYCGCESIVDGFELEHQTPRARGGGNHLDNMVYGCRSCNAQKHTKTVEEFRLTCGGKPFFAETEEGRQFVTRPGGKGATSIPCGVTSSTRRGDKYSSAIRKNRQEPSEPSSIRDYIFGLVRTIVRQQVVRKESVSVNPVAIAQQVSKEYGVEIPVALVEEAIESATAVRQ